MLKSWQILLRGHLYLILGIYTWALAMNFFDFIPPQDLSFGSPHPARVIFDYKYQVFSELFFLGAVLLGLGVGIEAMRYWRSRPKK